MVVLKKVKGSTLVEILIATIIMMVIFSISIMIVLQLTQNYYRISVSDIQVKLNKVQYFKDVDLILDTKKFDYWEYREERIKDSIFIFFKEKNKKHSISRSYEIKP